MKVVTFGEMMLRFTPPGYTRFVQAESFEAAYGGAEANVAVALSFMGDDSKFVTKLPDNALGQAALNSLRRYGVDTSDILRGGNRLGTYYLERGASQRASQVIYDRAGSSFAGIGTDEFDWDRIFGAADWFHLTGITPALGPDVAACALNACRTAKKRGLTVSFDPNYRAKLWTVDRAAEILSDFLPYVDILITNENQAVQLFGLSIPAGEKNGDNVTDAGYAALAQALTDKYGLRAVAITERRTFSADENTFCAKYFFEGQLFCSAKYRIRMIDRVGAGDAFAAGLIYAIRKSQHLNAQAIVEYAAAAGCMKHSVKGDYFLATSEEIFALAESTNAGQVNR